MKRYFTALALCFFALMGVDFAYGESKGGIPWKDTKAFCKEVAANGDALYEPCLKQEQDSLEAIEEIQSKSDTFGFLMAVSKCNTGMVGEMQSYWLLFGCLKQG